MPIIVRSHHKSSQTAGLLAGALVCVSLVVPACSKGSTGDQAGSSTATAGAGGSAGGARGGGGRGGRGGGGPVPVVTARAMAKAVPVTIPAVGTAEPLQTVEIRAQVTGQLSQIHFREGQDVRKGAPLFTLDARPFEA